MIISVPKNMNKNLSKNFKTKEFNCKCNECKVTYFDTNLITILQGIRDYFGKPVIINSGYRCIKHNKDINGEKNSKHTKGMAADIKINGISPLTIAKYAESIGVLGIIVYKDFVHIDTRATKYYSFDNKNTVNIF